MEKYFGPDWMAGGSDKKLFRGEIFFMMDYDGSLLSERD